MDHDDFIGHVQQRARLDSRGAAESATRATLETLAERLSGQEPEHLASQLPPEIGLHLRRRSDGQESFDADDFYERVAGRSTPGVDRSAATFHAKAVLSVVREAVTQGQWEHVVAQLPTGYADLFDYEDAVS